MVARLVFIFTCFISAIASAGPADVSRVLKVIDFEERRLGNREDLPMHWQKLEGPGLPHYVNGHLARGRAHSGEYSFRFDLNGGSLIYQYDPNELPVHVAAHYRVETYVETTALPNARARLTAFFTDIDGNPVPNTMVHSEPFADRFGSEEWHRLMVEMTASDPRDAFLAIQLELLQPSYYAPSSLGARTLFDEDINGSAWFDDVTISQVPEVHLSTGRPGNVFGLSDLLRLKVTLNDRFTDDLAAKLIIRDAAGQQVYQRSGALDLDGADSTQPGTREMSLVLPPVPPGWYDAQLIMTSRGQLLGEQDLTFIRLGDDNLVLQPDPRFGVIATDLPFAGWGQLPEILPCIGVGRVKLAVWSTAGDVEDLAPFQFDTLLTRLAARGITPTACLTGVPPSIAARIGGSDWARFALSSPDKWQSELAYLVARHANHLDRWQFGTDAQATQFLQKPEMRKAYDVIYNQFEGLVNHPDLAMPWPAWYDLTQKIPATIALNVPPEVLPSQIPLYIHDIESHPGHNLSLSLQLLGDRYGRLEQICDLAQRVVYALAGGADRIDLPLPFKIEQEGGTVRDEPQELLVILRTLIMQLGGASFEGKVPNTAGIEEFLFSKNGRGVLVLWNRGTTTETKHLAVDLGSTAAIVNLWGDQTPLVQGENPTGAIDVNVGPLPIFISGVDAATAQMRASVGLDKPLLESSFEPHPRQLHFVNPEDETINGLVRLRGPRGWTITPAVMYFSLNPGETFDRPITIEFPYNSFAGVETITAQFEVQGEHNRTFSVPISVSLGLSDVGMQTLAIYDKGDLVVQQMISNYGDKPINYTAYVVYPGQSRQERLVMNLRPGRTTIKTYRFANLELIPNAKVRSGLRELEGARILNDEVPVQ